MRILVVDDDVRLSRQITSALTEAGHDPPARVTGDNVSHVSILDSRNAHHGLETDRSTATLSVAYTGEQP